MKKWNAPEIENLDVKLTASGSDEGTTEQDNHWQMGVGTVWGTFDATKYEKCPEAPTKITYRNKTNCPDLFS